MNRKILQKVIDALKEDKKEYAMGILDTLIECLPEEEDEEGATNPLIVRDNKIRDAYPVKVGVSISDEGSQLDAYAKAMKDKLNLGEVPTE